MPRLKQRDSISKIEVQKLTLNRQLHVLNVTGNHFGDSDGELAVDEVACCDAAPRFDLQDVAAPDHVEHADQVVGVLALQDHATEIGKIRKKMGKATHR